VKIMNRSLFKASRNYRFDDLVEAFRWDVPEYFNIAKAVCDDNIIRSSDVGLICEDEDGRCETYSYQKLYQLANQLANVLTKYGVTFGDRVAVVLPQRVETAIAHIAIWKLGAISVPLSVLFGPEALDYRLSDSGAKLVFSDSDHQNILSELASTVPSLKTVINCDANVIGGFWELLSFAKDTYDTTVTKANDPAIIIYTSGTTGPPKGALVAHRCLLGNLPGFELSHDFFPQKGDLFWTPADWAWTGGLIDALLPAMYYGVPVLGYNAGKFDAERICQLISKHKVRNAFIPPTALKMMRQVSNIHKYELCLRSVMSAGEAMGAELYHWGREYLSIEINEMWAQSEFNYIVGNSASIMPVRPGSMGKAYPGHRVVPIDEHGSILLPGEAGELAAHRDDPVMFLGYWNNDSATQSKVIGDWWTTGDLGYRDEEGYLWFLGRKDDVISSAGYRIGPGEIEDCLIKHPAVAQAAVVGVPDDLRGEIVKAYLVLVEGVKGDAALVADIQRTVRKSLAAYEYPREIEFLESLPMTTTGKIRRLELRNTVR